MTQESTPRNPALHRAASPGNEPEDRWRQLVMLSPDAVFVNQNDRIVFANPAMIRLCAAADASAILGASPLELVHPDSRAVVEDRIQALLQGQSVALQSQQKWTRRDGTVAEVEAAAALCSWNSAPAIQVVLRDITEERRIEKSREETQARFRLLAEAVPQMIWTADANGVCDFVNAHWTAYTGLTAADTAARRAIDLVHPDDMPRVRDVWETAVTHGVTYEATFRLRRAQDGAYRWFLARSVPHRDANGNVKHWFGTLTDIQEVREARENLESTEQRFRAAFENVAVGMAQVGPDGRWIQVNRKLSDIIGYSQEELGALRFQDVTHPEDLARDVALARRLAEGEIDSYEMEKRYLHRDGHPVWVNLTAAALRDEAGRMVRYISVVEDITRRKEAEERVLELNRSLLQAMRETHHRVKNNLQIITALAELQIEDDPVVPVDAMRRIISHVHALAAIHEILTREPPTDPESRFLSSRLVVETLLPLVRMATGDLTLTAHAEDFPIDSKTGSSIALLINELVSNAVKHGSGPIHIEFDAAGQEARLTVTDSGPGFADGFDPAVDAHTGMALIESVGRWDLRGSVTFANRAQGGAEVTVAFPLQDDD